ncbi:MAG: N-acetylmuramoyl-L-alanine amidase [Bacteroidetes bacterium]|nr:N-acetylmuramoyl-L-alanine amidase [Bacteroidota bacterium]
MNNFISIILSTIFFSPWMVFAGNTVSGNTNDNYGYLEYRYKQITGAFESAYNENPSIPAGLLEAVSWSKTRMNHIDPSLEAPSCTGMPLAAGIMGLVADGKNYFSNTLTLIAVKTGIPEKDIISSAEQSITAWAKAFTRIQAELGITSGKIEDNIPVLLQMTELPAGNDVQQFAIDAELYQVLSFINDEEFCKATGIHRKPIDMISVFGKNNFKILSSQNVTVSKGKVTGKKNIYKPNKKKKSPGYYQKMLSSDYPPALWNPAASCNYTVGRTQSISAVTIHTVQGSYAGCISWFQNCNASVSAHYVIRSSDGQVTQMVLESNKAWHVGSENPYTIGYEHEGYVSDPSWYTTAMYTSSANLTKDVCNSGYGINPHRTGFWPWLPSTYYNQSGIPGSCTKIKGHMHFPNQTHSDPGPNWNWDYYFMLINDNPSVTTYTANSGTFYDSGGGGGNYSDDERQVYVISPSGATSVTLTFTSFSLENTWDYLYIYDGSSVWASRIGYYTGTSGPGTVTSSGGALTVEFRSDCATTGAGWAANWTSNSNPVTPSNLSVTPNGCPQIGVTLNWNNSGNGWYVDVSADSTFATFYNKDVSNLTSVSVPGGFCDYPSCNSYLGFEPNTTYYWRIWDGSTWYNGPSFTTPLCSSTDPSCSGNFFDAGGSGSPYSGNEDYTFTIAPALATSVSLTFSSLDLENGYDFLYLYNGPDTLSPLLGSYTGTANPGTITANSGVLTARFKSDPFVNNSGWAASWSCVQNNTPPTTQINSVGSWQIQNFQVNFTDSDMNGSGLDLLFYQPLEYNNIEWRANNGNGFFNDNFDAAIHPDWTIVSGNWSVNANALNQTDEANGNTNIYAPLTQTNSEIYLFHWGMNIGGSGTNRRAGLHFFCDNPALTNRGNSYFVYYRVDNKKCQIYKVINDVFALETDDTAAVNAGTWYDCKVIFNPQNGEIKAFLNNQLVSQWTDPSPHTSGGFISLRNGNANVFYNDMKVYRARSGGNVTITVGPASTNDIRYQNPDPLTPSCRIKSLVKDSFDLWSAPSTLNVNIDWTPPSDPTVNDGGTWDADTVFDDTQLSANWTNSVDTNSDVIRYWCAFGTTPGLNDVSGWTDNGLNTNTTVGGLSLVYGQVYYSSVVAENGAGLFSDTISSDGAYLAVLPLANFSPSSSVICAGDSITFTNYSQNANSYQWQFPGGNPASSLLANPVVKYDTAGNYSVTLIASNSNGDDTITDYVIVNVIPALIVGNTDVTCYGAMDGTATATAGGGIAPYSYLWSNGMTGSAATALDAGTYSVTVTDSAGCSVSASSPVSQPVELLLTTASTAVSCNGGTDGTVSVSAVGGTGPYYPAWSTGDTLITVTGLSANTYYVTVTDSSGCLKTGNVLVTEPSPLTISFSITDASCNGSSDGSVNAAAGGGTPSYSWSWSNNDTVAFIQQLSPGNYTVTVTDFNGCNLSAVAAVADNIVIASFSQDADTINLFMDSTVAFTDQSTGATSWQWDFTNGTNSTLQNPTATYDNIGIYQVILITNDGVCYDTALGQVVVVLITRIELSGHQPILSVYPAPGKQKIIIEINNVVLTSDLKITIYDILGQLVLLKETKENKSEIFVENLNSGIYFCKVLINGKNIFTGKLIFE